MRPWMLLLAFTIACGGPAKETATPDPDMPEEPSGISEATEEEGAEEAASESTADESSSSATPEDVQKVLQLVIDDGELEQFLKLGEPGRFPLKIAGDGVPSDIELTKGTKPVERVTEASDEKQAVLVFTRVDVGPKSASVGYRYDVEGIRGTATLKKGEFGWELKTSRIVER